MKVVMTTGTFDILHIGHIKLLERAKKMGDYLIVGLNGDSCVAESGKIVAYSYQQRKEMLEAIVYVDEIVPIEVQSDKYDILQSKNVDIFAIGSDYKGFEEKKEIEKFAEVRFIERTPKVSTSRIKKDFISPYKNDNDPYNTIVIDIDNTISFTDDVDFINSKPNQRVIEKINELKENGWKIILFTDRGEKESGKDVKKAEEMYYQITRDWLEHNGVKYDELRFGKPSADWYIDDKNLSIEQFINYKF